MSIEKIKPRFTMDKKIVIKYGTEYDEGARCLFLKTLKAGMESFQHITHIMELFKR